MTQLTNIRAAVHEIVAGASGLDADRIRWSGGNWTREEPNGSGDREPLLVLDFVGSDPIGTPQYKATANPTPSAGEEMILTISQVYQHTLRMTWYAGIGDGFVDVRGLLQDTVDKLQLLMYRDTLSEVGASILSAGSITSIGASVGPSFEPRSMIDLQISAVHKRTELVTNIETIEITQTGVPYDVPVDIS